VSDLQTLITTILVLPTVENKLIESGTDEVRIATSYSANMTKPKFSECNALKNYNGRLDNYKMQ